MQTHAVPRRLRRALAGTLAVAAATIGLAACHDLNEVPPSFVTPSTYFQTDAQVLSGLAAVYNALRVVQTDVFAISQASSDETIVPTRGTDWQDGGQWVELWTHTYGPNSGAGRAEINNAYNGLSAGIAKANATIVGLQTSPAPTAAEALAECRALRAFFYYQQQDLFGGVPIVTSTSIGTQARAGRDSVARFVESELLAVRPLLPAVHYNQGRMTRGAVDAILANLYLNWPVFTGTPTATGITPGTTTRYPDAIARTDSIINSGLYTLNPNAASWQAMFSAGNQGNPEHIFVVTNKAASNPNLGFDVVARAVHYNSYSNAGGYNGYSTIADTYNQFDSTDARKNIFLIGNQLTLDTHVQAYLRDGKTPLVFTPTISALTAAAENEGIRWYKFKLDNAHSSDENGDDFTIFRLGGVLLDRAEAMWRMGQTGPALAILNQLRARNYNPPQPITTDLTPQVFLRERLNELAFEGKRRQDMIRFGTFGTTKQFKTTADAGFQALFPIPLSQIQANPLLIQNPGY